MYSNIWHTNKYVVYEFGEWKEGTHTSLLVEATYRFGFDREEMVR